MADILCPKCRKPIHIKLGSNICSNCGFDFEQFYSDVESLYSYGLKYFDSNPLNSYFAFYRASYLEHAPSKYQLGILIFEKDETAFGMSNVSRKITFERCLAESATKGYEQAKQKLFQLKTVLITPEALNYIRSVNHKIKDEKLIINQSHELSEEIIRHKKIFDEAIKELNNLGISFKQIKKPYCLSSKEIIDIYNKCLNYDESILEKTDFFNILKKVYEEVVD